MSLQDGVTSVYRGYFCIFADVPGQRVDLLFVHLQMLLENGATSVYFFAYLQMLLENGADIENRNEDEETAMHVAAKCGHQPYVLY